MLAGPTTNPAFARPGASGGSEETSTSPSLKRRVSMLRNISLPSLIAAAPFPKSRTVSVPLVLTVIV